MKTSLKATHILVSIVETIIFLVFYTFTTLFGIQVSFYTLIPLLLSYPLNFLLYILFKKKLIPHEIIKNNIFASVGILIVFYFFIFPLQVNDTVRILSMPSDEEKLLHLYNQYYGISHVRFIFVFVFMIGMIFSNYLPIIVLDKDQLSFKIKIDKSTVGNIIFYISIFILTILASIIISLTGQNFRFRFISIVILTIIFVAIINIYETIKYFVKKINYSLYEQITQKTISQYFISLVLAWILMLTITINFSTINYSNSEYNEMFNFWVHYRAIIFGAIGIVYLVIYSIKITSHFVINSFIKTRNKKQIA